MSIIRNVIDGFGKGLQSIVFGSIKETETKDPILKIVHNYFCDGLKKIKGKTMVCPEIGGGSIVLYGNCKLNEIISALSKAYNSTYRTTEFILEKSSLKKNNGLLSFTIKSKFNDKSIQHNIQYTTHLYEREIIRMIGIYGLPEMIPVYKKTG